MVSDFRPLEHQRVVKIREDKRGRGKGGDKKLNANHPKPFYLTKRKKKKKKRKKLPFSNRYATEKKRKKNVR